MRFRECEEVPYMKDFLLKIKGKEHQICIRSVILYESETWYLRKREVVVLRKTERAIIKAVCGLSLMNKKNAKWKNYILL